MKQIQVGYLTHAMSWGGATMSLLLLQKSIKKFEQFEPYVYVTDEIVPGIEFEYQKYSKKIMRVDIKVIHNNMTGKTGLFKFLYRRFNKINPFIEQIKEDKIDILHINSTVLPHVLAPIKKRTNAKIVTHVREILPKYGFGWVRRYMISQIRKYSDAIIAISDNEAIPFKGHSKLFIIPNPVELVSKDTITKLEKDETSDVVNVGMVANFSKSKGNLEFVQAAHYVKEHIQTNQKINFFILGCESPKPQPLWKKTVKKIIWKKDYYLTVNRYISKHGLSDIVVLLPYTTNVLFELNKFDIIVRPALTADPWGRDIIEAMSLRKPVVATGSSQFFIKDNVTGYLVPARNEKIMGERLIELIGDPQKRKTFGANGYNVIADLCDIEKYGQKILSAYHSVLDPG